MALSTIPGHAMSVDQFYDTVQIVTNTNKRDVSDLLDLWESRETPFLNYIKWGEESGGTQIEWIHEHQGRGYVITGEEITGTAVIEVTITTSDCGDARVAINQLMSGACLLGYSSDNATYHMYFMYSCTATSSTSGEISIASEISGTIDSGTKLYVIGNFTNEGSLPRRDTTNVREVITNNFSILREDFSITGSMAATDMYAVANETRHQIARKLIRMQKHREMACFFANGSQTGVTARTSTAGTIFNGILYFIDTYNDSNTVDSSTTTLTESTFNNHVAYLWEANCKPNVVVGNQLQIRKFTQWDRSRVRTEVNNRLGGFHVTKYLTEIGIELDLLPIPNFPLSALFTVDTSKIKLRAKRGRKLFTEKLGIVGDYTQFQMLSEFSLECRGGSINTMGGAFKALT